MALRRLSNNIEKNSNPNSGIHNIDQIVSSSTISDEVFV